MTDVKNLKKLAVFALTAATVVLATASSCSQSDVDEYNERSKMEAELFPGESLEQKNLKRKAIEENDPGQTRYVYLFLEGVGPIAYYVIEGKVSSSGSQYGPSEGTYRPCSGCDLFLADSPQDDKTFGEGDPGKFFWQANGTYTSTDLKYLETTAPVTVWNVPLIEAP